MDPSLFVPQDKARQDKLQREKPVWKYAEQGQEAGAKGRGEYCTGFRKGGSIRRPTRWLKFPHTFEPQPPPTAGRAAPPCDAGDLHKENALDAAGGEASGSNTRLSSLQQSTIRRWVDNDAQKKLDIAENEADRRRTGRQRREEPRPAATEPRVRETALYNPQSDVEFARLDTDVETLLDTRVDEDEEDANRAKAMADWETELVNKRMMEEEARRAAIPTRREIERGLKQAREHQQQSNQALEVVEEGEEEEEEHQAEVGDYMEQEEEAEGMVQPQEGEEMEHQEEEEGAVQGGEEEEMQQEEEGEGLPQQKMQHGEVNTAREDEPRPTATAVYTRRPRPAEFPESEEKIPELPARREDVQHDNLWVSRVGRKRKEPSQDAPAQPKRPRGRPRKQKTDTDSTPADEVATAEKKKAENAEKARLLAIDQQRQQDEAAAKAADEERSQRREKIFNGERALLTMAADWRAEAENGKMEESESKIALLLCHFTDLLATCIAQQEDIHSLNDAVQMHNKAFDQVNSRLQQLEQRPVTAPDASSSNNSDRLNSLEIDVGTLKDDAQLQQTATQQLEQRFCAAAANPSSAQRETTPKFDGQEIFCDSTKTDPIPWFRKFELKLQLHHVSEDKHHAYFYSRSGGACQAWLDNPLSKYGVVAADLYTKINWEAWDDLKAAWHKRFRVQPPEIKAMDRLTTFEQGTLSKDKVAVGDILVYVTKVAREFRKQRYDDNNAPLLYVRIQVGQASCNALLDSSASCNFMSQAFMQRAGLGALVRRKANPTAIKLANERMQQLIDCYIEAVPVYFAPHACEPVTFDILDTDFDIILGLPWLASADHTVNFHRRTLTVRDAFGAEVSCTISLLYPSIRCQVVTAKPFWATCAYEQPDEIGLCFLRTVAVADSSPTDLSSEPRVVRLLDEFIDIFESPTGVVPDRPTSHEIILEDGAVPPKGCIYLMSEEELTVHAQLDNLLDKGWIRFSSSPYGAPVLFVWKKNKDLRLCIDYHKLNVQTVKNAGPLHHIDDLLERLGGAKYFSKLDLKSGYHQISIRPHDRYNSAFKTRYGHFEWVAMLFGLTNTPTTFQAAMTNEFRAMLDQFVLVYLDDILVYSRTFLSTFDECWKRSAAPSTKPFSGHVVFSLKA
ncbi:hypothetical protein CBR_g18658 [Chara braunii]|uniref:Reverse transcriptase domain-containing protein n=1 Tax=Chara braunii TaxID=69332 RepID=A0A388JTD2_CHABU|nr:hypothetical protein CBR_g18658 [Chara braunii]|eukprot:GBG61066.1 hypothetical protein CBR_g18658 [Chara braunii]